MKRIMMFSGILALVAVALVVWLVVDKPKFQTPEEKWRPKPLVDEKNNTNAIEVISEGKTIRLVYKPEYDAYALISGDNAFLADNIMVDRLNSTIRSLKRKKLIDLDPADLTIYNLKPPVLSLSVVFDDPPEILNLEVGKENYTHDAVFAKLKDEPTVFLIPLDINIFVGMDPKEFRTRALMHTVPMNVAAIEIKIDDPELKTRLAGALEPKLVVQKQVDVRPQWVIVQPINENAVFNKIDDFFQALRINDVFDIIDVPPAELAKYGLDQPRAIITLSLFSGDQQKVLFGRQEGDKVYVMNTGQNGVVYSIPISKMYTLLMFNGRNELPLSDQQREIVPVMVQVEYPRSGLPSMQLNLNPDRRTYSVTDRPDLVVTLPRVRRFMKAMREGGYSFVRHLKPYPLDHGLDNPKMHIRVLEGDTVPVDIAIGDTATVDAILVTFVEDRRRNCVMVYIGDLLSMIPYGEKEFVTPPKGRREQ